MESDTRTNKPTPLVWSYDECVKIASQDHFPAAVQDLQVQKEVITRYLNIYCGGKKPKGFSIADLTFAVIAIMPLNDSTEQFLWDPSSFKDEGTLFKLVPAEKEPKETKTELDCKDKEIEKVTVADIENVKEDDLEETNIRGESESNKKVSAKNDAKQSDFSKPPLKEKPKDENQNQDTPLATNFKLESMKLPSLKLPVSWDKKPTRNLNVEYKMFTPLHYTCFNISVNKLLAEWKSNATARIVLKYFLGIVALVFLRATTKKSTHLIKTFRSDRFINMISFVSEYIKYASPQTRCIKNSSRSFRKRDCSTSVMFAKILIKYYKSSINIFRKALLNHTMDYGLGLVSMLRNLNNELDKKKLERIYDVTLCEETLYSWKKLLNFLDKYENDVSKHPTHHWARIIGAEYFTDMCCSDNYVLSVVFAVFIEKVSVKSDVWRSAWVKCGSECEKEELETLQKLGIKMYEEFLKS